MPESSDPRALRRRLRAERRRLSRVQQKRAAEGLAAHLSAHPWFLRSRRVAFYIANDGELDLSGLLARARAMGKACYLPILRPLADGRLWFGLHRSGEPLQRNRFGIPEPDFQRARCQPPWTLDLVLTPLVAFDGAGNRLGMGGGFYDKTFAFRRGSRRGRPRLLGVAHAFQQVPSLAPDPWDVPLDGVVTERGVITPASSGEPALSA